MLSPKDSIFLFIISTNKKHRKTNKQKSFRNYFNSIQKNILKLVDFFRQPIDKYYGLTIKYKTLILPS